MQISGFFYAFCLKQIGCDLISLRRKYVCFVCASVGKLARNKTHIIIRHK